jgi:hypothetical protein
VLAGQTSTDDVISFPCPSVAFTPAWYLYGVRALCNDVHCDCCIPAHFPGTHSEDAGISFQCLTAEGPAATPRLAVYRLTDTEVRNICQ